MTPAERTFVRRLRRQLPVPVYTRRPGVTLAETAAHEAAHVVVAMALGGAPLLVHIGKSFGGLTMSRGDTDGICCTIIPPHFQGSVAVAGMIADGSEAIGPTDGLMLLDWLNTQVGPWPARHPGRALELTRHAQLKAKTQLRIHAAAVTAVAAVIERSVRSGRPTIDGTRLTRAARRASPNIKQARATQKVIRAWRRVLSAYRAGVPGDTLSVEILVDLGFGQLLRLIREEIALQKVGKIVLTNPG